MECFIDFSATNKIDKVKCVEYHETLWSLMLYFWWAIGLFFKYSKQNTWMLGNMKCICRIE